MREVTGTGSDARCSDELTGQGTAGTPPGRSISEGRRPQTASLGEEALAQGGRVPVTGVWPVVPRGR